jgi:hypothetical protein
LDFIHEQAQREGHGVKHSRLTAAIRSDNYGQTFVERKFDVGKAPEVLQKQLSKACGLISLAHAVVARVINSLGL